MALLEKSKITFWERHVLKKKKCFGRFRHVATLRKKVFWRPPVKCFSLSGSNNWDSFPFENAAFGDTKDHTLTIAFFQQRISMKVLRLCLPYVKGEVLFSFRLKLLRFSSFQECCFWRGERSQFEKDTFSKKVCIEGICLYYVKKYFEEHQSCAFLFMAHITEILLFSGMLLLERSRSQFERNLFSKKKFTIEVLVMCLPSLKRYFQEHQ